MSTETRTCGWCREPFLGRSDAEYCSRNHKRAASRARKREGQRSNYLADLTPLPETSENEGGYPSTFAAAQATRRQADARWQAIQQADQTGRVPEHLAREWREWERRNPGVGHPDRHAFHVAQVRAENDAAMAAVEYRSPQNRYDPSTANTVAEAGRLARGAHMRRQRGFADVPAQGWDDDPDLTDAPRMVDMGDWRRGRGRGRHPFYG